MTMISSTASDLTLTRVMFDGSDRHARRVLASRERLHALVETALDAGGSVKSAARRLWRLERTPHGMRLYMLADRAPSPLPLQAQLGEWCDVASKPYTPFLDSLAVNGMLRLEGVVCATHSVDGRRTPIPAVERETWMRARLAEAGCEPLDVRIGDADDLRFDRHGRTVTFRAFHVENTIRILDPHMVRGLLTCGVGRGKGYGLGMLCPGRLG